VAIKQAESLLINCRAKYGSEDHKVKVLEETLGWFKIDQGAKHKHIEFKFQRKAPQIEDENDTGNTSSILDIIVDRVTEESRVRLADVQAGLGMV